eukprot:Skav202149  [mRNA]  locus=scaffold970:113338:113970:- [translate_table: standard]
MAKCNCCNCLGSSRIFQVLLIIALVLMFIGEGVFGISYINKVNLSFQGLSGWQEILEAYEGTHGFYYTAMQLAYWFGAIVSVLWLAALCSRCCAPCCCELSDVPHPCSPCCQMWHLLDVPFYVVVVIAPAPVNSLYLQNLSPEDHWSEEFRLFLDVGLVLGLLLVLLAIPFSCVKLCKMAKSPCTAPGVAQTVGHPVTIEATAVQSGNAA